MHSNITTFSQRTSLAKLIHELQPIHRHRTLCYSNIKPFSPNTNFPPRYALSSLTFPTTSSHFYNARLYPQIPFPPPPTPKCAFRLAHDVAQIRQPSGSAPTSARTCGSWALKVLPLTHITPESGSDMTFIFSAIEPIYSVVHSICRKIRCGIGKAHKKTE